MGQLEQQAEDETRARLLETARVMVLRGDSKFSIASLCAATGVDRATFRSHFAGKTALMATLMRTRGVAGAEAPQSPEPVCEPGARTEQTSKTEQTSERVTGPAPQAPVSVSSEPVPDRAAETKRGPVPSPSAAAFPEPVSQPVSKADKTPEPGVPTPDAWLERRLRVFERALNALEARADATAREQARAIAQLEERLGEATNSAAPVPRPAAEAPISNAAAVPAPQPAAEAPKPAAPPEQAFQPAPDPAPPTQPPRRPQEHRVELAGEMQAEEPPAEEMQTKSAAQSLAIPPAPVNTVSKEEMAGVLQSAREKARAAASEPQAQPPPKDLRGRWLALAFFGLMVLLLGIGLSLGKNLLGGIASARESDGVTHRQVASSTMAKITALADAGNSRAQAQLALAYLRGKGSTGDANAALLWCMSAAQAGNPVAQYLLGALYQQGDHVKADPKRAFAWFSQAAEKGNLKAMHNLAIAYAEGLGTTKDEAKAAEWFTRSAERGYVDFGLRSCRPL